MASRQIEMNKYTKKNLKLLATMCIEKNLTTDYVVGFCVNSIKNENTSFLYWKVEVENKGKKISISSIRGNYPLDRIINLIGGLK